MSLMTDLHTRLDAALAAAVTMKVRNEGDSLPAIVLHKISGDHEHHMTAATGKVQGRIQVDALAASPVAAETLAESIRQEMDGFRGLMGSTFVSTCHLDTERDLMTPPIEGRNESGGVYTVQQDYTIGWSVSVPTFA